MSYDRPYYRKLVRCSAFFLGTLLAGAPSVRGQTAAEDEGSVLRLEPREPVSAKPIFAGRWQDVSPSRALNTPEKLSITTIPGEVISEAVAQLDALALGSSSSLQFNFDFSTQESRAEQTFADSVTLTLSAGVNPPLYIFTADVNGMIWAPDTPGGFQLNPSLIQRTPTSAANNPFPNGFNYFVSLPVPAQFEGLPLRLTLDLLNNQDQFASFASLDKIAVVIPEPLVCSLLMFGGVAFLAARKLNS